MAPKADVATFMCGINHQGIPDLPIRIWLDTGELRDIEYLAFMHPDFDLLPAFPNLKAMFSRAAGAGRIRF